MIRGILFFFGTVLLVLLGFWTKALRVENHDLQQKVQVLEGKLAGIQGEYDKLYYDYIREENLLRHGNESQAQSTAEVQTQLEQAKQRLQSLKSELAKLRSERPADPLAGIEQHISEANATIAKAQADLAHLNDDGSTVVERSKAYRQGQDQLRQQQRAQLDAQMQANGDFIRQLRAQIQEVSGERRDPNRAARLQDLNAQLNDARGQQGQLKAQHAELDQAAKSSHAAIGNEVREEQGEIQADRAQAQRQLTQAKADLEYWRKQKAAQRQGPHDPQVKSLEQDISQQSTKIRVLEQMLQALRSSP